MSGAGPDIESFEALRFDAAAFDHEAHVYVARELVLRYGQDDAATRYCRTLRRLTQQLGVPGKYHETITRFYIITIAERLRRRPADNWEHFRAANPDILDGTVLAASYSPERLAAAEARRHFLLPDRQRAA